jgi:hypothetical protein
MKFVYEGTYTEFMGRMFAFGREVEVTDRATIAALEKRSDFRKVDQKTQETVLADECPTCHKIVKRGKFMHQKYCGK